MKDDTNKSELIKRPAQKNSQDMQKATMLKALQASLGVVTTAAKKIGIGRTTHYDWMHADPDYANAVTDLDNVVIDFAESQLHKQINDGSVAATIFLLKTKGKNRGYVERQEITGMGGSKLDIQVEVL
jgi:hypothetical protein